MTKTLEIKTTASCYVTEWWTFQVPDNFRVPKNDPDLLDKLLAQHGLDRGVTFLDVSDTIHGEHDRETVGIEVR